MEQRTLDQWVNTAGLVVCGSVALPVVIGMVTGSPSLSGPVWLFWLAYGVFVATLVLLEHPSPRLPWLSAHRTLALMIASSWTAVSASANTGWSAILLVFTVAFAAALLAPWATMLLVVAQTGVVFGAVSLAGAPGGQALLAALVYASLMVFVAVAGWSEQRAAAVKDELAATNVELRAATALLAESSRAEERLRIARELHDVLGHQLTVLALELEVASHRSAPPASEHVERARTVAKELLADVRGAVGELRARPGDLGDALRQLTLDLQRPRPHLHVDDDLRLDDEAVASLLRVVQELVTNAIRHARADHLWIAVRSDDRDVIELSVRDDGDGTDQLRVGHGLTGARERVEQLGGRITFDTREGFSVTARIPAATPDTASGAPVAATTVSR